MCLFLCVRDFGNSGSMQSSSGGDEEYDLRTKFFILDCESYSFLSLSFYLTSIGLYPDFIFSLSVDKVETLISNYFYK